MSTPSVNKCLDEIDRLRLRCTTANAHLAISEFLLYRMHKLGPHLIADGPHNAVALETLLAEMREFLAEDRDHPAMPAASVPSDVCGGSSDPQQGNVGRDGTSS